MARLEQPIKDYGRKLGLDRNREYRVTPAPILWHRENNNLIYQAFMVLQSGLVAVPLIAGMDKFVEILANWPTFLAPAFPKMLGVTAQGLMYAIGAFEIVLAIGLALWPRVFSLVMTGWMIAIIVNLLTAGQHYALALLHFGLAAAAYALSRLSQIKEEVPVVVEEAPEFASTPELAH